MGSGARSVKMTDTARDRETRAVATHTDCRDSIANAGPETRDAGSRTETDP